LFAVSALSYAMLDTDHDTLRPVRAAPSKCHTYREMENPGRQ
jgi:hypothetical protein